MHFFGSHPVLGHRLRRQRLRLPGRAAGPELRECGLRVRSYGDTGYRGCKDDGYAGGAGG